MSSTSDAPHVAVTRRQHVPFYAEDRYLASDLQAAQDLVLSGRFDAVAAELLFSLQGEYRHTDCVLFRAQSVQADRS